MSNLQTLEPNATERFTVRQANAPTLRPYQLRAIEGVNANIAAGSRAPLVVSPTGSGKTVIAGAIIKTYAGKGKRVLFLAPRRELVNQASRKLVDVGVNHGIILAGDKRHNVYSAVQVGSIDTVRARASRLVLEPDVIVLDEAHLYVTEIRRNLLARFPDAIKIGLTATPCRKDGRGLNVLFDSMVEVATTSELTAEGHLVSARYFSIAEPDMARVRSVGGDFHMGEAAAAMGPLVADIPKTWMQRAGGRRTVVFAITVAHSVALKAAFLECGVSAEHVDGSTPTDQREDILKRFSNGEIQVLCNVQIASIGFDLPELDCIVMARPTRSLAMYLQMLGRGLRPAPGKTDCLVLDHSGCVRALGFAHDDRQWTLDGHAELSATKVIRERSEGKTITCPQCSHMYHGSRTCPSCGHYIAARGREVRTLDGNLVELGARLSECEADQMVFFLELRGYAELHNFKPGFAAHKFKEKHGRFPPWGWNDAPSLKVSLETQRWIKSRFLARGAERSVA